MDTENEALKKICPIQSTAEGEIKCCGVLCMMWTWAIYSIEGYEIEPPGGIREGYCGLMKP